MFANQNSGKVGVDQIVQPGESDGEAAERCVFGIKNNVIGTLAAFVPIKFGGVQTNTVDGAIISTSANLVNTSTLKDGYGVPTSKTVAAFLTQRVQKYGRATGYTSGTVTTVNMTVNIPYNPGTAKFINQFNVTPDSNFSSFGILGDSGSLVVDFNNNPVGLLFAGNGFATFGNPINDVLSQLATQLKLNQGVPADTVLSVDSSPPRATGKDMRSQPNSP